MYLIIHSSSSLFFVIILAFITGLQIKAKRVITKDEKIQFHVLSKFPAKHTIDLILIQDNLVDIVTYASFGNVLNWIPKNNIKSYSDNTLILNSLNKFSLSNINILLELGNRTSDANLFIFRKNDSSNNSSGNVVGETIEKYWNVNFFIHSAIMDWNLAAEISPEFLLLTSHVFLLQNGSIYEVYRLKSILITQKLEGIVGKNVKLEIDNIYYDFLQDVVRRKDFRQQIIFGTAVSEPLIDVYPKIIDDNGILRFISSPSVQWFHELRDFYNFTERAVKKLPGELLSKDSPADISVTQTTITDYRAALVTFLQPHTLSRALAFFEQPSVGSTRNVMTSPFSTSVWISIFLTIVIIISLSLLKLILDPQNDNEDKYQIAFAVLEAGCLQGWNKNCTTSEIKIIFFTTSMMALVLYNSYTAIFYSRISTEKPPIHDFDHILAFGFTIVAETNTTVANLIQKLVPVHKRRLVSPLPEMVGALRAAKDKIAFVSFADKFYSILRHLNMSGSEPERYICETLDFLPINRLPLKIASFVKKGSQFKEFFNIRIVHYMESGRSARNSIEYKRNTEVACLEEEVVFKSLEYTDILTAVRISTFGLCVSLASLIIEVFLLPFRNVFILIKIRLSY